MLADANFGITFDSVMLLSHSPPSACTLMTPSMLYLRFTVRPLLQWLATPAGQRSRGNFCLAKPLVDSIFGKAVAQPDARSIPNSLDCNSDIFCAR